MNKYKFTVFLCFIYNCIFANLIQYTDTSSTTQQSFKTSFSGYIETYYCYDFSQPSGHERPFFLYNHKRHNEVNINLAYIKASVDYSKYRANLALMTGNYAQYNLSSEPSILQNIFEANIGIKLTEKLWLDAGVFPSHIGFESVISSDSWILTRSIVAENSPYYETGVKLTWTPSEKLSLSALYLNGWQRISRIKDNQTPCGGSQITYKINEKISINHSTFLGNVYPDSSRKMRLYNDLFATIKLNERLGFITCFDYGVEQKKLNSIDYYSWNTSSFILRYKITNKVSTSARFEHFSDPQQVIVITGKKNGFQIRGYSCNIDFNPYQNVFLRIEGRYLDSKDKILKKSNIFTKDNISTTASVVMKF